MRNRWLNLIGLLGLVLILGAQPAHAVCTNPDGVAGSIVFNKDHQVMQYCDDTNWRQIGPEPNKPQGCANIGDTCTDGSIYAGYSPDGNARMYTTPTDAPDPLSWNNGTLGYTVSGQTSFITGESNTATLITLDSNGIEDGVQPHVAAQYCAALSEPTHDDWYLPARNELNVLFTHKNTGDLNGTFDESGSSFEGYYWASSESSNWQAFGQRFSVGTQSAVSKLTNLSVRCVRKEANELTSIVPDGLVGHWKLDESGFPYVDSSPTGANAINSGGTNPVSGSARLSEGLDFLDDSGRRISTATSATYAGLTTFTISAWIKSDDVESGGYNGIVDIEGIGGLYVGWNSNRLAFRSDGWDTQVGVWTVGDRLASSQWHHVAVTYDTAAPSGTKPTIYVDGVGDNDPSAAFTGSNTFNTPASSIITIGAFDISGWRGFNGEIDDVRIYNRILSAEEINYLANSFDTNITYDTDRRVPKYFNGDDWVAMGESKYVPNAVAFSEAEGDSLQFTDAVSSLTGTKQFTYSMWFRRVIDRSTSGCQTVLDMDELGVGNRGISFFAAGDGRLVWRAYDSAAQELLNIGTSVQNFEDNRWYHIIGSFDISNPKPATRHVYVNDALDQGNDLAIISGPDIDFSTVNRTAFGANTTTACGADMEVADAWLDVGTYIDLSIEANRRKFIDENGDPVYLGVDGRLPTGNAPDMFLSGDTDTWHLNKGTGGGFTENGELTDALTKPASPFLPTDGLVGYWKLDEIGGSSVIDYASANNGIWRGSDFVQPTSGVFGGAQYFDPLSSNEVDLGRPTDLDMSVTNAFTISAWVKPETYGVIFSRGAVNSSADNTVYLMRRYNADPSRWNLGASDGVNICDAFTPVGSVEPGVWQHLVGTWDGTNLIIYKDGINIGSQDCSAGAFTALWDGGGTNVNRDTSIGADARSNRYYWNGSMDEVAVYNRALTQPEIAAMYQSGVCANPERLNGTIVYNATENVMQYCDALLPGNGWQAIGQ